MEPRKLRNKMLDEIKRQREVIEKKSKELRKEGAYADAQEMEEQLKWIQEMLSKYRKRS